MTPAGETAGHTFARQPQNTAGVWYTSASSPADGAELRVGKVN
jgi:hypothetical protein